MLSSNEPEIPGLVDATKEISVGITCSPNLRGNWILKSKDDATFEAKKTTKVITCARSYVSGQVEILLSYFLRSDRFGFHSEFHYEKQLRSGSGVA